MKTRRIDPREVRNRWAELVDMMNFAPQVWSRDYVSAEVVLRQICDGQMQLWELGDGDMFVLTSISATKPRTFFVNGILGENMKVNWPELMKTLSFVAKLVECDQIRIWTNRPGMGKLLRRSGYESVMTMYSLSL